jgi:undecaprenyl-diphosphatase
MGVIQAIILGIIQGLTEFIPISSTAHLTIAGKLMNLIDPTQPEKWTAFMAVIQLGTLAAVMIYFSKELKTVPCSFIEENFKSSRKRISEQSENSRLGWLIVFGSVPIFAFGLLLKKIIEGNLTKDLSIIAGSLIVLAVIMFIAEKLASLKKDMTKITIKDSIVIGLAQCLALIPGSSRSGTTITAGLFLGLKRDTAAKFSFLMSIPAILASGIYQFYKSLEYITTNDILILFISTLVAGISGYAAIAFLIRYLKTRTMNVFVIYRIVAGLILFILIFKGVL